MSQENQYQPGGDLTEENFRAGDNAEFEETDFDDAQFDGEEQEEFFTSEEEGFNSFDAETESDVSDLMWNETEEDVDYSSNETESNEQEEEEENEDSSEFDLEDLEEELGDPEDLEEEDLQSIVGQTEESEEELIKKLEAKGYKVDVPEDQNAARIATINQGQAEIDSLNRVFNQSDKDFLTTSVRNDLHIEYQKEGRAKDINSAQFNEEVEDRLAELELNTSMRNMYLKTQKSSLYQHIQERAQKLNSIKEQHKEFLAKQVFELKQKTKQSVTKLAKSYGMGLSEAKEVFRFIQSNEYKSLVNNPDFVVRGVIAELAERKGKKLFHNDGSYARGVKETIDEIKSNGTGRQTPSQLGKQMKGTATLGSSSQQANPWLTFHRVDEDKVKKQPREVRAAGRI